MKTETEMLRNAHATILKQRELLAGMCAHGYGPRRNDLVRTITHLNLALAELAAAIEQEPLTPAPGRIYGIDAAANRFEPGRR